MGLMTISLPASDSKWTSPYFHRLYELGPPLLRRPIDCVSLKELSQGSEGMLNEYHVAVEKGATMVRVGTATIGAQRA